MRMISGESWRQKSLSQKARLCGNYFVPRGTCLAEAPSKAEGEVEPALAPREPLYSATTGSIITYFPI